jgi:hypothetical protein
MLTETSGIDSFNHVSVIAAMSQWFCFMTKATSSILGVRDIVLESKTKLRNHQVASIYSEQFLQRYRT